MRESMPEFENKKTAPARIHWQAIEKSLNTILKPEGGYSDAERGFVSLAGSEKVFVKLGTSEASKKWATKEIGGYEFLEKNNYPYIPQLLSINQDRTGFAIEALTPEKGWDWSDKWTDERIEATLKAMDALAKIKPGVDEKEFFKPVIFETEDGWPKLFASPEQQLNLKTKLGALLPDEGNLADDIEAHMKRSSQFQVVHDTLVHDDVRGDNCAWNKELGEVKMVDWNWLQLGDRRIDLAAMLAHVYETGFDVVPKYKERLDSESLHWMGGFWLNSASKPVWPGGPPEVRDVQVRLGISALKLAAAIEREKII